MSEHKTCSQCGEVLPADASEEICSYCLQRSDLPPGESPSRDDRVNDAILLYLQAIERGEPIDREKFLAEHADIAQDLKSFFGNQMQFQQVAEAATLPPATSIDKRSFDIDQPTLGLPETAISSSEITLDPLPTPFKPDENFGPIVESLLPDSSAYHPASARDLPEQFGRYRIRRKLGAGGMGAVYLAHDQHLDRLVAIKTPLLIGSAANTIRARFQQEARAAAALTHANICPIFDVGELDGILYMTMLFVRGQPLSERLKTQERLPEVEAVNLVQKLAQALAMAHGHGVIHRDLKPANVMMLEADSNEPMIMDFGLAKRKDVAFQITQQGEVFGTPRYMSPEQFEGNSKGIGPATDIYSLGVILYQLLCGSTPFHGDFASLAGQVAFDPPPRLSEKRPEVSREIEEICLRALAKKPADRWPTMRQFAQALGSKLPPISDAPTFARPFVLHIVGSRFAYRPRPGATQISIGRQKRRFGEPDDTGNDFVIRVEGNEELSRRISRRHFEIRRSREGWLLLDHSKRGLEINGCAVPPHSWVPFVHGDRINVAGVLVLEVQELVEQRLAAFDAAVNLPVGPAAHGIGRIAMEPSMGDMVTIE